MSDLDSDRVYKYLDDLLGAIIADIDILAGDTVGPSDVSWQDVAGTLMTNMRVYALRLERVRTDPPAGVVFPSVRDKLCDS